MVGYRLEWCSLFFNFVPAGKFIKNLLDAADGRNSTRARTAATFTLLNLCEGKSKFVPCIPCYSSTC